MTKLLGYDFDIQYRPGRENGIADALTRVEPALSFLSISIPWVLHLEDVKKEVEADAELREIVACLQSGQVVRISYTLTEGILRYKGRVVLSKNSQWVAVMLAECHDTRVGGHSGFLKTYKRIASEVCWRGMKKDVRDYVARCAICQQNKYEALFPKGLLQPLSIPDLVWADISLDFIEGLPKSGGMDTILVVVD